MHNYGPVSRLLLLPLHGGDEVDHSSSLGRDSDFRPAVEVEEPDVLGLLFLARRGGKRSVQHCVASEYRFKGTAWHFKKYAKKNTYTVFIFYD